jgi:hypothetical protein
MFNLKAWFGTVPYISELDQFLNRFRQTHPKLSPAQQKERDKYAKIASWRDQPRTQEIAPKRATLWEKF